MFVDMCRELKEVGVCVAAYCADGDTKVNKAIEEFLAECEDAGGLALPIPVRVQDPNHMVKGGEGV